MTRRMLFPLRRCPGLVPIRELDLDIVVVVMDAGVSSHARTLAGVRQSQRAASPVMLSDSAPQ